MLDIIKMRKFSKFNLHSKIALISTAILIPIGTIFMVFVEFNNPATLGKLDFGGLLASFFQSVTARTAGFNTIDLSLMHQASLFIMIILMFIGALPASTGGGIRLQH